jgi:ATP-dependent Lon protease
VRNLEREVAGLCRKVARMKAEGTLEKTEVIGSAELSARLGVRRFTDSAVERRSRIGVANGLAWTETGGDLLTNEVSVLPGKGDLLLTGKLGDVMRESARPRCRRDASARGSTGFHLATSTCTCTPEALRP